MKIILLMVMSTDGIIAKKADQNSYTWNSREDKEHFMKLTREIGVIVMGSNTYKASGRKSYKERITYVLTRNPLELDMGEDVFAINGTPQAIAAQLREKGHDKVALLGGAKVNRDFLLAGLVDELYLTIEPKLFGKGLHLFEEEEVDIGLKLISHRRLNDQGTLLLHYGIKYGSDA